MSRKVSIGGVVVSLPVNCGAEVTADLSSVVIESAGRVSCWGGPVSKLALREMV